MKIPAFVAKFAYNLLNKWVIQDGSGSFPYHEAVIDKDDMARELIETHEILKRIPDPMMEAMHRVVHASAMGSTLALFGQKDREQYLFVSGEVSGMRKAINGIEKIANMDVTPLKRRILNKGD